MKKTRVLYPEEVKWKVIEMEKGEYSNMRLAAEKRCNRKYSTFYRPTLTEKSEVNKKQLQNQFLLHILELLYVYL
ncbi:hypothetical protein [Bacillus mycoides]|uniref:hypothetical protein n=1 Tax=Bacillus mycoides TaxID=1405 RepID=UPI0011A5D62B|nr:hypothetical protein [Bacillus mycoides]